MLNFYNSILENPLVFRQFSCGDNLTTLYNCPLRSKLQDLWSHHNYIVYVVEGRKVWHTADGSYDLREGSCFFVRKGAYIVEQFFDANFCLMMFFIPDDFIGEVLKSKASPIYKPEQKHQPVMGLDCNEPLSFYMRSMLSHFNSKGSDPDRSLIELKFRELILTLAENSNNRELLSYFSSLLYEPGTVSLQRTMDANYCFNLKLEQFAALSNRSLSAFKRDFQKHYQMPPGKWLMEKRLDHAMNLLTNGDKTVSEVAFESGFEHPSHFTRTFRQRFGVTPLVLKKGASS